MQRSLRPAIVLQLAVLQLAVLQVPRFRSIRMKV
jgi:hypothetical protein